MGVLKLPPEGWPLCVAMRGSNAKFVETLARALEGRQDVAPERKRTISELLFVVTAAIFGAQQARRIFEMNAIIDSPGVQDLIRQLRAEGEAKGRAEGERNLLLRLIEVRFGKVPAEVVDRVHAAGLTELEFWAERVLTAAAIGEIFGDTAPCDDAPPG